jgi:hypothetical protein
MDDIVIEAKGYAWGRHKNVNLSGLHLYGGIKQSEHPGLDFVQLHGITVRAKEVSWSSYLTFNYAAMDELAQEWLSRRGYLVVRQLEAEQTLSEALQAVKDNLAEARVSTP